MVFYSSMKMKIEHWLLAIYVVVFIVLGINPVDRATWISENIPIVGIVLFLALTYKKFKFSSAAYLFMSVLVFMHTVGGHYTFEKVPFDWVTNFFGFQRNHYDRIAHFSVGFYAYALAEFLDRKKLVTSRAALFLFPVFAIFTVAAIYEIVEWIYAASSSPEAGAAFLGSQGDIWDAQKDMLADGLGGILATAIYFMKPRSKRK